jgi:hypothetical protein
MSSESQIARACTAAGGAVINPRCGAAGAGATDRTTRLAAAEAAAAAQAAVAATAAFCARMDQVLSCMHQPVQPKSLR